MIWLLIGLAFVAALVLGAGVTILFLMALVVVLLVFAGGALIWAFITLGVVFMLVESDDRVTSWLVGLALVSSLVIIRDQNRSNLEPTQSKQPIGEPPLRRRRPETRTAGSGAAPATTDMSQPAPAPALPTTVADVRRVAPGAGEPIEPRQGQELPWPFEELEAGERMPLARMLATRMLARAIGGAGVRLIRRR